MFLVLRNFRQAICYAKTEQVKGFLCGEDNYSFVFQLSFEKEGVDYSHKVFNEGATITTIIGSKGDEFGERTSKKFFNGRRRYWHGIQHRIANLIPKMIALFALEFLTGEFGSANWNLLGSKGTGDFISLTETARLAFPNLLALA